MVNYVEINLSKPDIMRKINFIYLFFFSLILVTKSKLIIIKYKYLFLIFNIEIYDDKNMWSSINSNIES